MSINSETLQIANVEIDVIRKDIKNMHLAVYPPLGKIRLAVPKKTDEEILRLFAISKLGWIKKHVKNFKSQPRETKRDYVSGESHYYQGKRYILEIDEKDGYSKVLFNGTKKIQMRVPAGSSVDFKSKVMKEWYRKQLKSQIPPLLEKWERILGVKSSDWGVKKMKTKWGSCNTDAARIWLNLELAKRKPSLLEYVLVHELIHLREKKHNKKFRMLMNKYLPKWEHYKAELNNSPIVYDS